MPYTVVIADDVTGANDIGIMYAGAGLDTYVYSLGADSAQPYRQCDVLVVDTDSRFDTRSTAYRKVYEALLKIPREGVRQYVNKQCSVFRGNIGAEFDAMLDALSEEFAVVVLGFPDNGRTTVDGIHYVFGTPLAQSQFSRDPVHPMTRSSLREILQEQTQRKVGCISFSVYDKGQEALEEALADARTKMNYCIMDVRDNADLQLLAAVLQDEKVICGSSALSKYLAQIHAQKEARPGAKKLVHKAQKVLCTAGSLTPQTAGQTDYIRERGFPVITLDTTQLFEERQRQAECARIFREIAAAYETGDFVMVHSANRPKQVAETKALAGSCGIGNTEVSTMVSGILSEIACRTIETYSLRRIIVCGGDTSAALCACLGVRGMKVLSEIEAGLPICESVDKPHYRMVLKSGSFGSREFIEKAREKLCMEEE